MSNLLSSPQTKDPHWEPKFPFDLVVAYEDRATRARALQLYDHLAGQLLDDYDFKCAWWKFDHLGDPSLREHAVDDAADANMIVLSVQGQRDLPAIGRAWIEDWLPRRDNRKSALVALVAQVPIFPVFIVRTSFHHYKIIACEPIHCLRTEREREVAIEEAMEVWSRTLEKVIAEHWSQWFSLVPIFSTR